jgi:hypothetical protein
MPGEQGPGIQKMSGTISTLRFGNVCDPVQPPKLWPMEIAVTFSSREREKAIAAPCEVVPLHSPA